MDRNTVTGLVLIFAILVGFQYFTKPSAEEIAAQQQQRDSIAHVEQQISENVRVQAEISTTTANSINTIGFMQAGLEDKYVVLENSKMKLKLATRGGRIAEVVLKEYTTHDSLALVLWKEKYSRLNLNFYAYNQEINTENYLFVASTENALSENGGTLSMRLYADSTRTKYLEYQYTLSADSYMLDFDIKTQGLNNVIASNSSFLTLNWSVDMPQQEKSRDFEKRYTGLYYKFYGDDVENLSTSSENDEEDLTTGVEWIDFKQQFFSSILIFDEAFADVNVKISKLDRDGYLKKASADIPLAYSGNDNELYSMNFFFGPNDYNVLKAYDNGHKLTDIINMGWKWVSWFNKYFVVHVFDFLQNNTSLNYGIIILILTLLVKLILFPLTYKSYISQAKMRVLKPQIEAIHAKIPADKAMERQQATMKLYNQAGVNPLGGCLPMVIQMPVLIALFYFFPGAIALRQQSFLWATDLASYDSIATLPFTLPFYGNHVSLFCLLMTVTNIFYTWMNSKNQPQNDQMKGMQSMMYLMPLMFLFIFNNYSAGLSYYYFISTLITILQTVIMRKMVDDKKLLQQIELAKTKPKKKSGFLQRLEQVQKEQQKKMREQKK